MAPANIVDSTRAAVHRRDHHHDGECCTPHCVEIIHLGREAMAICHDCSFETDVLDEQDCCAQAKNHTH